MPLNHSDMIVKTHYNKISEPIKVSMVFFEINFMELATLTLSLLIIMLFCGAVNVFIPVFGGYFFLFLLVIYTPLIYILSYSNRQDHPQFLLSWISFRLFQPKRIVFFNPTSVTDGR